VYPHPGVATIRDEAICVRLWDWSETSQTVSLFTREHGMLRGLAKGAKREHSPYSGGFELLTRGEIVAIVKKEGQLATLTAWDLVEPYRALRGTLAGFYSGCAAADIVHHAVTDHDPHPALYDAMVEALGRIELNPGGAMLGLVWSTLCETGYRPSLDLSRGDAGAAGGVGGAEPETFGFSPRLGGLVGDPAFGGGGEGPVWRVRGETVAVLRGMDRGAGVAGSAASVSRALRLLLAYLSEILGREPPAVRPFLGVLPGSSGGS